MASKRSSVNKQKTLYLIDGSAYIYRAYHAIRGLSNSNGLPTNAVLGFTKMLLKLIKERKPEYMVMFFDSKGPTFRHEIYKDYKANRPPMPDDLILQLPYIKDVTKGFSISVIEKSGYEADDLIGTYARIGEQSGFSVIMVTGDKDFIQLVTNKAIIWDPMKDKIIDMNAVNKSFGIQPSQIIDVMGLSGDTSDNVAGVPSIGPKTALSLIKTFGSMKSLFERIDAITPKKKRENLIKYKQQAFLSRKLVTIDTNVNLPFDLEKLKCKSPDNSCLSSLFKLLEFKQLQQVFTTTTISNQKKYQAICSIEKLDNLVKRLESATLFALDTETTSKSPMRAKLVGLSFSVQPNEAFYIPCAHEYPNAPKQLDLQYVLNTLKPVLENPDIKKIGQNIKYDWIVLERHGVKLNGVIFDTMLASYLINPSKRSHGLDQIAIDFLDYKKIAYKDVITSDNGKKKSNFAQVSLHKATPYACEDADITMMAYNVLTPKIKKANLINLLEKVEMPLVPVLIKMETRGICVDKEKLQLLSKLFKDQLEDIETQIYSSAGEEFNIQSSQQLGQILFDKLKLPTQKKTKKKTGYSTDVEVLTTLASKHELPAFILRYRMLAKLKSTYTDALLELIHPETGRIHTSYNQTVTATGRLSSSDPNLQNIPIRGDEGKDIRKTFVPQKGWFLVGADYSQIELRILAHYSKDQILIKAFQNNEDIHTRTATEIFQVFPSMITHELRRQAKIVNFGVIYGMSPYGLSKELGISRTIAKTYINNYFARYKGVKNFIENTIAHSKKINKTTTLLGRTRFLPDINSSNKSMREFAERTAINTPIQGTAADLIKLAMTKIDAEFQRKKLKSAMLLSVHDELVFETPPDELDVVKKLVKKTMQQVWKLAVPLKVNVAYGKNWAEAH